MRNLLFTFILALFSALASAQTFSNIAIAEASTVCSIAQDEQGMVWLGTDSTRTTATAPFSTTQLPTAHLWRRAYTQCSSATILYIWAQSADCSSTTYEADATGSLPNTRPRTFVPWLCIRDGYGWAARRDCTAATSPPTTYVWRTDSCRTCTRCCPPLADCLSEQSTDWLCARLAAAYAPYR